MKKVFLTVVMIACAFAVFAQATTEAAAYPVHSIEFVVNGGAGGGSDIMARTIVEQIQNNGDSSQGFVMVNKSGGSGTVCHAYVNSKSEPDYTIMTVNSANILTMNISNSFSPKGPYTPIAVVAMDNQCFVTSAESQFKTWADVEAYMKANPASLTVGCADDLDEMALVTLEESAGVKFNRTAFFSGSSEVVTALLGGHVQFAILNPVECISLFESGRVTVLGAFAPEALEAPFDVVPTFKSLGYESCVVQMFRGVMGAAGMSREAQKYLSDAIEKATQNESWKTNYLQRNLLGEAFMDCDEFAVYLKDYEANLISFAKKAGML